MLDVKQQLKKMKLDFSIQLFSSLNRIGLEELASVMGGRLNYTLDQTVEFDLDQIPEASETRRSKNKLCISCNLMHKIIFNCPELLNTNTR